MKKKYLTKEEFQNRFKSGEKLEFSIDSPFGSISIDSEKTLFFARHWDPSLAVTGATGTAYICRKGDSCAFDFDVLSLRLNKDKKSEVSHVYTQYHHTDKMPQFIIDQMPKKFEGRIQNYLKNR